MNLDSLPHLSNRSQKLPSYHVIKMMLVVWKNVTKIIVITINGITKIFYVSQHSVWYHVVDDLVHFDSLKHFNKLVFQLFLLMDGFYHSGEGFSE